MEGRKLTKEMFGLFLIFLGLFLLLGLITYSPTDPSLNHATTAKVAVQNSTGTYGAYLAGVLVDIFGIASFVWPLLFLAWGIGCVSALIKLPWFRWLGFLLLALCLLSLGTAWNIKVFDIVGGGFFGGLLYDKGNIFFSKTGSSIIWLFFMFISLELCFGIPWLEIIRKITNFIHSKAKENNIDLKGCMKALPKPNFSSLPKLPSIKNIKKIENEELKLIDDDAVIAIASTSVQTNSSDTTKNQSSFSNELINDSKINATKISQITKTDGFVNVADINAEIFNESNELQKQYAQGGEYKDFFDNETTKQEQEVQQTVTKSNFNNENDFDLNNESPKVVNSTNFEQVEFVQSAPSTSKEQNTELKPVFVLPKKQLEANAEFKITSLNSSELDEIQEEIPLSHDILKQEEDLAENELADNDNSADDYSSIEEKHDDYSHDYNDDFEFDELDDSYENDCDDNDNLKHVEFKEMADRPAQAQPEYEGINNLNAVHVQAAPVKVKKVKPKLPSIDLLHDGKPDDALPPSRESLMDQAKRLMTCLADFNIQCELIRVTPGPVVSMFEIRPAPGVKVSRIVSLTDDLAMALLAHAVRIQAPIPGTDTVGIEIPNKIRATVNYKELLQDPSFNNPSAALNMALGKDIGGQPFAADLVKMPHMLVAGATGAGKSVCINSILMSFLYRCTPDDVRFLLVDPKRVELAVYADLPHLVHPVITEMDEAKTALEWAVHEMDNRYKAMTRLKVRNLVGYNQALKDYGDNLPKELEDLKPLPLLVIIIDELADLMMVAGKDAEAQIVRLAQLARAAGIHLIIATQRPSVDVVTGLIKANFPCRVSFQVTSRHDSKTILDAQGAENLLGRGDMLYKPSGGKIQRLHGAFVSDEEVLAVTNYWKSQVAPDYAINFADWGQENAKTSFGTASNIKESDDGLYKSIVEFTLEQQGKVSISLIQRRFRIGFNKAALFVEQMEQDGVLSPKDRHNKPKTN